MTRDQLRAKANELPLLPGVYLMMDKTGQVIYVGKAKKLKNRVSQYFQDTASHNAENKDDGGACGQVRHHHRPLSEFEALVLENSLIKRHHAPVQHPAEGRQGLSLCAAGSKNRAIPGFRW